MDFEEFALMVRDLVNDIERGVIAEAEVEGVFGEEGLFVSFRKEQRPIEGIHAFDPPSMHLDLRGDLPQGD
jgi:hypothetical protein